MIVIGLLVSCCGAWAAENVVFHDSFSQKLGDGWSWLRENLPLWRLGNSGLEIRNVPGDAGTVKNALVRQAPDRQQGKFAIEVLLTSLTRPTQQFEQAGIAWYHEGQPVFKLVKELVDGQLMIIPGRKPMTNETVELRLLVTADSFTAQFRPGGKGEFQTAETGKLPVPGNDQVSMQCYHGPTNEEHWVKFENFRVIKLD